MSDLRDTANVSLRERLHEVAHTAYHDHADQCACRTVGHLAEFMTDAVLHDLEADHWLTPKGSDDTRDFDVLYMGDPLIYTRVRGRDARHAVERRLEMLGGAGSCAPNAWFEVEGQRFPIKLSGGRWVLVEAGQLEGK